MKLCIVENCNNFVFSKKYCKFHQFKRTDIKKSLNIISEKQLKRLKIYRKLRDDYMNNHKICENKFCSNLSEDLHHCTGRIGKNLFNNFKAVCRNCHNLIHDKNIKIEWKE